LILLRLLIVADATQTAVCGRRGIVSKVNRNLTPSSSKKSPAGHIRVTVGTTPVDRNAPPKYRTLHLLLLLINLMNGIQSAVNLGMFFGGEPKVSCEVPLAAMELLSELGVFFLILFLLSKLDVTNSHYLTLPSCFEQAAIFANKVIAYILYPALAIFFGVELAIALNKE
ncbi:unnamed protein product, partial [Choristocarpus tenellus]